MHVLIINGSPRVQKYSNTDKIITKLVMGMKETDPNISTELYSISDHKCWDDARKAFMDIDEIVIALPLYFECIPGLLLEFLTTLPKKNGGKISFVLQSGFAEASQLRCCEEYLKTLPSKLGCSYGGTLLKGDNFSIRFFDDAMVEKVTGPYVEMGKVYGRDHDFESDEVKKFAGPEYFGFFMRGFIGLMFKTFAAKMFRKIAKDWGCEQDLRYKAYQDS